MIKYFGLGLLAPLAPSTVPTLADMGIQGKTASKATYVLYIGAGAVAAGGMISPGQVAASNPVTE